ncbi:MAG: hypothetical protein IH830_14765, partial [Planctomycetes bacterium]|nr:hypothetical protein [Planctomycetota bacterium]
REQATPFTLALLGDWGAGKSSVMKQLTKELDSGKYGGGAFEFLFATFNAWQYEHTDDIRAGLAQEVVSGLTQGLGFRGRWWLTFRFAWAEHQSALLRTVVSFLVTLLAVSVAWLIASMSGSQFLQSVLGVGAVGGVVVFIVLAWKNVRTILNHPLATQLQTYLKLPDYGKHLGAVPVMKKHIKALCDLRGVHQKNRKGKKGKKKDGSRRWILRSLRHVLRSIEAKIWHVVRSIDAKIAPRTARRLVVFVDDLDRCGQECVTQTFDAIRLVMEMPNVIVVIAIDYRIAFAAVAKHYANLAGANRSPQEIARDYLGKIIQLPVELPRPSSMQSFIRDRLFSTVDKDEVDALSRRPDTQSSDEKLKALIEKHEESEVASESTSGTEGTPSTSPASGEVAAVQTIEDSKDEQPIPAMMQETATDCRWFEKWTRAFKFDNPRQLIRLRNTYRLLTQLDHALDHEPNDELRMVMLFWLEFLYQKPIKEQKQYQDLLVPPGDTVLDGKSSPERDRMGKEITEFGIREFLLPALGDGFDERRFEYERLTLHIGRFVLRFGGESPPDSD